MVFSLTRSAFTSCFPSVSFRAPPSSLLPLLSSAHPVGCHQAKEHPSLSTMASVPLRQLFASRQIISLTELSLTANQKKADMRQPMVWREESTASAQGAPVEVSSERPVYGGEVDPQQLVVELGPFEIRTFALTFKPFSA
ncbi:unnamed protein product [Closterium sp. Yama58-4]|nr:unnamed protein product [Closterium sp. Yama58-4]